MKTLFLSFLFMAFTVNAAAQDITGFAASKKGKEYNRASLAEKFILNKKWAAEEVLPALSVQETALDERYVYVRQFGQLVAATNFSAVQDVDKLTSANPEYWKAVTELEPRNQLVPATKLFMIVSQGYFDYASSYCEMLISFSGAEDKVTRYLEEFDVRMEIFNAQLNAAIDKGIALHDKGDYIKALKVYNEVLQGYPNSARALYENYYSKNMLAEKNGVKDPTGRKNWDQAKPAIFKSSPLYHVDILSRTGNEGYKQYRRQQIEGLFKFQTLWLKDMYTYADIALDLGLYDFAAQVFWVSFNEEKADELKERSLYRFLYALEKLGIPQLKEDFDGDFVSIFKAIDAERQKAMEENVAYKYFEK